VKENAVLHQLRKSSHSSKGKIAQDKGENKVLDQEKNVTEALTIQAFQKYFNNCNKNEHHRNSIEALA